jgi:hypothetical protein
MVNNRSYRFRVSCFGIMVMKIIIGRGSGKIFS